MKLARTTALAALTLTALAAYSPVARAEEVSPTGKGIAGGALLGAEIVVITESLVGVKSTVAYLAGAGVGAAAGGVGGYFIEQSASNGRAPVYMLAAGLALIIPGVVLTLNATRYTASEGAREDKAPEGIPPNPGASGGSAVVPPPPPTPPASPPAGGGGAAPKQAPVSMLDWRSGGEGGSSLRLGLPVPDLRPTFSTQERRQYGMAQVSELRLPLVQVAF